jgi:hypothetical protein
VLPLGLLICPSGLILSGVAVSLVALLPPIRRSTSRSKPTAVVVSLSLGLLSFCIAYLVLTGLLAWEDRVSPELPVADGTVRVTHADWFPWLGLVTGFTTALIVWLVSKRKTGTEGASAAG